MFGEETAQNPVSATAMLVMRAQAGDGTAYKKLLARLAPAVRAFAQRRLGQREAVDDFTQDALLLFIEALRADRLEDPAAAASFALGICRNLARERAATRDRRKDLAERYADFPEVAAAQEPRLFDRARLEDCLSYLTGRAQKVLLASYFEERADAEIAAELAMTASNVRVTRHRSIAALRECIETPQTSWESTSKA